MALYCPCRSVSNTEGRKVPVGEISAGQLQGLVAGRHFPLCMTLMYERLAAEHHINHELLHRITTMSAGTLDALPHNGTVLLLLQISGLTHRESYLDMVMTVIVSCIIALIAVLIMGSVFGSF